MLNPEILLLGLALAIDAAVVSFAIGLLNHDGKTSTRIMRGLVTASAFGLFQFLMLWLGSYAGFVFTFSNYGYLYQLVVASLFVLIAAKFFHESFETDRKELTWGTLPLIIMGIATSVDALAAGVSFATLPRPYLIAGDIGIITFLLCGLFYLFSQFFKNIPEKWLLRLAGIIFLALGGNIVRTFIFKGAL
ncbi:MAG TPA: manganese efflux pump [Bacteriovoracaceae bacterium]|nr:manganese efflux pump [Bacteriovoracaceae bacterium]